MHSRFLDGSSSLLDKCTAGGGWPPSQLLTTLARGGGVQGLQPSHTTSREPLAQATSPASSSLEAAVLLVRPRPLGQGCGACTSPALGLYLIGLQWHGPQVDGSHHSFPSGEGAWGLPTTLPEPPGLSLLPPSYQNLLRSPLGRSRTAPQLQTHQPGDRGAKACVFRMLCFS